MAKIKGPRSHGEPKIFKTMKMKKKRDGELMMTFIVIWVFCNKDAAFKIELLY